MQFDLFHVYTVDQHILFTVRNLRRFAYGKYRELYDHAPECFCQGRASPRCCTWRPCFTISPRAGAATIPSWAPIDALAFCARLPMPQETPNWLPGWWSSTC